MRYLSSLPLNGITLSVHAARSCVGREATDGFDVLQTRIAVGTPLADARSRPDFNH